MKELLVSVTADDIAKGKRRNCGLCPIALALNRATGLPPDVGETKVYFHTLLGSGPIFLPVDARAFIQEFDNGLSVSPISFWLFVPDNVPILSPSS